MAVEVEGGAISAPTVPASTWHAGWCTCGHGGHEDKHQHVTYQYLVRQGMYPGWSDMSAGDAHAP